MDLHQLADLDLHFLRECVEFEDLFICVLSFLRQCSICEARDIDIFFIVNRATPTRPCHCQNVIIY